jgi:hypothetical protein
MTEGDEDQAKKAEAFAKTQDALRELRAEILDFQNILTRVKDGKTNVKENAAYIKKTCTDVDADPIAPVEIAFKCRKSRKGKKVFTVVAAMLISGCAHYPDNLRLDAISP